MALQLMLSIVARRRWVLGVPAALGGIGAVVSLVYLLGILPLGGILLYWGVYFLSLWLVWLIVSQVKQALCRLSGKG